MKFRLLQVAEMELDEAVAWYQGKGQGVAARFIAELAAARDAIVAILTRGTPLVVASAAIGSIDFPMD